ncbi:MAG: DnaA ATPase domain-containing protein, partial [Planctomycetota bacterium]
MSAEPEVMPGAGRSSKTGEGALDPFLVANPRFGTREEFWQAVQQTIRERLGLERFSIWFRQTELMSADDERIVVGVPNVIIQQFLTVRYTEAVTGAVEELVGRPMQVSFDVAPSLFRQMRARRDSELLEAGPRTEEVVNLRSVRARRKAPAEWGFEHLILCPTNTLPYAAARELAGQENPRLRFLYVCGDYGLGKTALLRAMFTLACAPERGLDAAYTSAEDWCNEYYHSIQRKTTHPFRSRYRSCDVLLLDDVEFIEGKGASQRELLHTVKHILGRGGRVALSSTPHPE